MKQILFVLLIIFPLSTKAQNVISTLAGNGKNSYSGDGGMATAAQLNTQLAVRGDVAGNIYIADNLNFRIRKVDAATGIIHTIAGTGIQGFSGDGGPAANAQIKGAWMYVDNAGNIYLTDNNRIRKIDAVTNIIHTIAGTGAVGYTGDGGTADTAAFNGPAGIVLDGSGNIYVSDAGNNVIRKINAATNIITTIVGDGYLAGTLYGGFSGDGGPATNAELYNPEGICLDALGNIYFCDYENYRVRQVNITTGIINTVAGAGASTSDAGDGGLAVDAYLEEPIDVYFGPGGNLYIDQDVHSIRMVDGSGVIQTVIGNAGQGYNGDGISAIAAELHYPSSVYCDAAGNIFIGDGSNMRVRKVNTSGIISTYAGNGFYEYSGDGGPCQNAELNTPNSVCADGAGNIYFIDWGNNRIRKIDAFDTITTIAGTGYASFSGDGGPAIAATMNGPGGISISPSGDLYFADEVNFRVRKINMSSGIITTVAGNTASGYSGDGGPATAAKLEVPVATCVDAVGNLYIGGASRVRKVDASTGIITTIAGNAASGYSGDGGPAAAAFLGQVNGLCVNAGGDLYISDRAFNVVRKITARTGIITTVAGNGYVGYVNDGTGNTYFGGFSGDGGPATAAELDFPEGLCVNAIGVLFIADYLNNVIRCVGFDGNINTVAGSGFGSMTYTSGGSSDSYSGAFSGDGGPATAADLYSPLGVYIDGSGNMLIADAGNNRIRQVNGPLSVKNVSAFGYMINLFPNPATTSLTITSTTPITQITITNLLGQTLYTHNYNTEKAQVDVSGLPTGVYFVKINGTEVRKFVKG